MMKGMDGMMWVCGRMVWGDVVSGVFEHLRLWMCMDEYESVGNGFIAKGFEENQKI